MAEFDLGGIAGAALDAYTGGLSGGAASAALSGSGKKQAGGAGSGSTVAPNQTAEQRSSQTVNTTVTVGDGGNLSALLPLLLANRADFSTVQGYSAESVLSGRGSIGTYAIVGALVLAGVMLYKKL